jgi:hypothetical protein
VIRIDKILPQAGDQKPWCALMKYIWCVEKDKSYQNKLRIKTREYECRRERHKESDDPIQDKNSKE